jgi:hypothetical protein
MNLDYFNEHRFRYKWSSKPSEQPGYIKNYWIETPEGDRIDVDMNYIRQMVRIGIRLSDENGKEYFSVIKSGTILQERDLARKRTVDLQTRLGRFRKEFGFLRDENVLRFIGGNYGLPVEPYGFVRRHEDGSLVQRLRDYRKRGLLDRIRRHLEKKREEESLYRPILRRIFRRLPAEMGDACIGALPVAGYYYGLLDLTEFAALSGFTGLAMGAVDWVWRQRDPFLPKVIIMLAISGGAVYFQVQNRLWGQFL